jgi:hypothetical protein
MGGQEGEAFDLDGDADADTDVDADTDGDADGDDDSEEDADDDLGEDDTGGDGDGDADGDDTGDTDGDDTGEPPPACDGLSFSVEMHNPDTACTECDSSDPFTVVGIVHNPCDDAITLEHSGGLDESMFESVTMLSESSATGHGSSCDDAVVSTDIAAGSSIETRYEWGLLGDHEGFPTEGEFEMRVDFCTTGSSSDRPEASVTFTSIWPPD